MGEFDDFPIPPWFGDFPAMELMTAGHRPPLAQVPRNLAEFSSQLEGIQQLLSWWPNDGLKVSWLGNRRTTTCEKASPAKVGIILHSVHVHNGQIPIWSAFDWYYTPTNLHTILGMISIDIHLPWWNALFLFGSSSHPILIPLGDPDSVHGLVVEASLLPRRRCMLYMYGMSLYSKVGIVYMSWDMVWVYIVFICMYSWSLG